MATSSISRLCNRCPRAPRNGRESQSADDASLLVPQLLTIIAAKHRKSQKSPLGLVSLPQHATVSMPCPAASVFETTHASRRFALLGISPKFLQFGLGKFLVNLFRQDKPIEEEEATTAQRVAPIRGRGGGSSFEGP